jgi:hypothetical protein
MTCAPLTPSPGVSPRLSGPSGAGRGAGMAAVGVGGPAGAAPRPRPRDGPGQDRADDDAHRDGRQPAHARHLDQPPGADHRSSGQTRRRAADPHTTPPDPAAARDPRPHRSQASCYGRGCRAHPGRRPGPTAPNVAPARSRTPVTARTPDPPGHPAGRVTAMPEPSRLSRYFRQRRPGGLIVAAWATTTRRAPRP